VKLENSCLVFGNWFGIMEMATERMVKSIKHVPKTAKELNNIISAIFFCRPLSPLLDEICLEAKAVSWRTSELKFHLLNFKPT
jgi:hypothetical protein